MKGLVRNRHLAKSISDAGWSTFRSWLEYFGHKYRKVTVAVPPHNTSQNCSNCGQKVKKSLSTRTHVCPHCGFVEDRDVNAAINILKRGLSTVGHTGTYAWEPGANSGFPDLKHLAWEICPPGQLVQTCCLVASQRTKNPRGFSPRSVN